MDNLTPKKQIQVTLLANEGILLQSDTLKILIDGIHENNDGEFNGLSKQVLKDLIDGEKLLFQNIDYILYTHCHYDHFSAAATAAYLERHPVKGVLMPDHGTRAFISLRETASRRADSTWLLDLSQGVKNEIKLSEDFTLTVFRSVHAGAEYADVDHFCYLLNFGGRKLFIIGDSEYNSGYFSQMLAGEAIDAAFVNPLFLNKHDGREVLSQALKPKKLIIYHIPFEGHDKFGFRKLVIQDVKKYRESMPDILVLWNELQSISI